MTTTKTCNLLFQLQWKSPGNEKKCLFIKFCRAVSKTLFTHMTVLSCTVRSTVYLRTNFLPRERLPGERKECKDRLRRSLLLRSRAKTRTPCLGADQKTRGLWERDWRSRYLGTQVTQQRYMTAHDNPNGGFEGELRASTLLAWCTGL